MAASELKQLNIRLPADILEEVRVMAVRSGYSPSDVIRTALVSAYPNISKLVGCSRRPSKKKVKK